MYRNAFELTAFHLAAGTYIYYIIDYYILNSKMKSFKVLGLVSAGICFKVANGFVG